MRRAVKTVRRPHESEIIRRDRAGVQRLPCGQQLGGCRDALRLPLLERRELRRPFASVPLLNTSGGFGVPLSLVRLPLRFSVEIALPLLAARHVQHSRSGLKASPLDAHTRSVISQRLVRANMPSAAECAATDFPNGSAV